MSERRWIHPEHKGAAASQLFTTTFQRDAAGVWAAPGRINLIGEHVDYNLGRCLPSALPHRTFAATGIRSDRQINVVSEQMPGSVWSMSLDDVRPGAVDGWAAYLAGVAWALRRAGADVPGMDIAITSSVPLGAGLSSSAALECSLAIGLAELLSLPTDDAGRQQLAAACVSAENDIAGANTGGMDQSIALRGEPGHALLLDCRSGAVEQIPFDPVKLGLDVLVIDTAAQHALVDGQYASRRADCERAASLLGVASLRDVTDLTEALEELSQRSEPRLRQRVRHVATELDRVTDVVRLLSEGDIESVGPVLDASHASLRDDYEVSCVELDVAVDAARKAGALGARMVGGGFGGSAIALVPADAMNDIAAEVASEFSRQGFVAPGFLKAPPSAGAERAE